MRNIKTWIIHGYNREQLLIKYNYLSSMTHNVHSIADTKLKFIIHINHYIDLCIVFHFNDLISFNFLTIVIF